MRGAPLTDRWSVAKVFVVGTMGLAVVFASPALSLAERPQIPVVTYCGCTCWYSGAGGETQRKGVTFTTDKICSIYNGQTCYCDGQTCYSKYNAGAQYKGELQACKEIAPMIQGEPPTPVPPRGVKPPVVAPGVQPPAAR